MWACPLQWPANWSRTETPKASRFQTTLFEAKRGLEDELYRLGAVEPIVTQNIRLNRSGWPDSKAPRPPDSGVAVYFTLEGREVCFPCDKWFTVADNIHAIELTVAALRGIERWGAKQMMDAAFAGYAALPESSSSPAVAWWTILEVSPDATEGQIQSAYRQLARRYHPDNGGTVELMSALNASYEQALKAVAA
jgi:hypothetical protein